MTLPANIRVNVKAPFPASVTGAGFVFVAKSNGVWTIEVNYNQLAPLLAAADLPGALIAIFDPVTGQYNTVTAAQIIQAGLSAYRIITAAGDVNPLSTDVVILLNKTAPAATNIFLPPSTSRDGIPLTVKDYNYSSRNNVVTFVPAAGETIDGFTGTQAAQNGVALININGSKKTLYPLTAGGWYL